MTDLNTTWLKPTQPWADEEFDERVSIMSPMNPGEAYKLRPEVWDELMESDGKFSYTYHDRVQQSIDLIIETLQDNPPSRQLFMSIWDLGIDPERLEQQRVPCSLGYYFQYRRDQLDITYLQRSCDFVTHYQNDVYLAVQMLQHICDETDLDSGHFSHWIGSLHVMAKDVADVF